MSVQLIVYPQNYEGVFNAFSGNATEVLVNGISFNDLDNTSSYTSTSGTPYVDTMTNAAPTMINTWLRYRVGASAFPTVVSHSLVLNSLGNGFTEPTGIYQKISNLTIGQTYTVKINIGTQAANGTLVNRFFDGLTPQGGLVYYSTNVSTISKNFTATNTEMTYMLAYYSTAAEDLTISSMSVLPIGTTVADPLVADGQSILDLYEDEDLPLTLSVDDFKNVAEKVQSYSKAFNLPATKRNNKIFSQVFEVTRSNDGIIFNVYRKTKCVLKQDGFVLFEGYLRLLDVTDKGQEISYSVNLYSEVIALADYLKDSDFRALDFSELVHDYNKTEIINSWNDSGTGITYSKPNESGFRNDYSTLKYPFVDWNRNWVVSDGTRGTAGNPELLSLEQVFRPFINVKYLIDRIFEPTPFTYDSTFFSTADFGKLYMDFNWGSADVPAISGVTTFWGQWAKQIGSTIESSVYAGTTYTNLVLKNINGNTVPPNYDLATNIITATADGEQYTILGSYRIENTSTTATRTVDCQWLYNATSLGVTQLVIPPSSYADFSFSFNKILFSGDTLQAQFKRNNPSSSATARMYEDSITPTSSVIINVNTTSVTSDMLLQTLRGETGQWEFIKGLMTMFNLITTPDKDNPNNIIIEPYVDVFMNNTDTPLQWTDKVDTSEMKLTPLADLNKKTIFKFVEDDDDFAFTNYKNQVGGHLYGSKKYDAGSEFNILEGTNEVIAEPFAATVIKALDSVDYPLLITPSIYSYNAEDDTTEGFENSPRIMYNNGIKGSGTTYYIPSQNGVVKTDAQVDYLQFSHIKNATPSSNYRDFHFGECQVLSGVSTLNNLFNLYWLPYYSELYNPDTRIMTIKVNLTPADINTFKFSDTVQIKNRTFRVNKIDYKPNDLATVEFILIP
jgi:hypothetical protein